MKEGIKKVATSKRMLISLSALLNFTFILPLLQDAQVVKAQTDSIFALVPYGNIISWVIVIVHVVGMGWTKFHDDKKWLNDDSDTSRQVAYAEQIKQQEVTANEKNNDIKVKEQKKNRDFFGN